MIPEEASGLMPTIESVHIFRCSMVSIILGPNTRYANAGLCHVTAHAATPIARKIANASIVRDSVSRNIRGYVSR